MIALDMPDRTQVSVRKRGFWRILFALPCLLAAAPAMAQSSPEPSASRQLTAAQMFDFADAARDRGDFATADMAYRALAGNRDLELRTEARFRLAMMLSDQKKYGDAGIVLRQILDEKPKAARVRLELARIDALLGHAGEAGRQLRAAQAAGLPPEVERVVRFYAQALDARRPSGGAIEVAIAPDSNVNRATSASTLGTVIGDFTLNRDAQAHSGLGLAVRGQGFVRAPLNEHMRLIARLSGSGMLYRTRMFNDITVAPRVGPEWVGKSDRLTLGIGPTWRWYGMEPYTQGFGAEGNWQRSAGSKGQLRLDASLAHIVNKRNALETGNALALAAGYDRALSPRLGIGAQVSGGRQTALDPGYATASYGASTYVFREIGKTSLVLSLAYNHLEADERLLLFAERRIDNTASVSLNGTFRQIRIGHVAPIVRLRYDRNLSTVGLYAYERKAAEIGIATAF